MQDNTKLSSQLCGNVIFSGLSRQEIARLIPCIVFSVEWYEQEQRIYNKGDEVKNLGIVLSGGLRICEDSPEQTVVLTINQYELFGETVVFAESGIPYNVIAEKNTQILYLTSTFFHKACQDDCRQRQAHQIVMRNLLSILSRRTNALNKKISYLTAPDLKTKIAMYLCDLYEMNASKDFNMPHNRDQLSIFFSVARPSLSRELINFKKQGVIDFYRSSVEVLNVDALYELAGGGRK